MRANNRKLELQNEEEEEIARILAVISQEVTAKAEEELSNVESHITGSVKQLCVAAAETAEALGYKPVVLTASLSCEAKDAGSFLASVAQYHAQSGEKLAFIAGGETVR